MKAPTQPIVVHFPLRGEWLAPNTPGSKVPTNSGRVMRMILFRSTGRNLVVLPTAVVC